MTGHDPLDIDLLLAHTSLAAGAAGLLAARVPDDTIADALRRRRVEALLDHLDPRPDDDPGAEHTIPKPIHLLEHHVDNDTDGWEQIAADDPLTWT
jgi:hypothetical protein